MTFDPQVPLPLKEIQCWFGSIISRRIDRDSQMMPISPSGMPMSEEAGIYIRPSPTLQPDKRIQIYNQQYWWRLLNVMQDNFPLVTRLFGYAEFNEVIAEPYLEKYPPRHWSLSILGDRLNYWIEEDYMGDNRQLVRDAVLLDYAFFMSFLSAETPALDLQATALEEISEKVLHLQPHVYLFAFDYDMITLRKEMLKESPEYWTEHDFPEMTKGEKHYFVVYRNKALNICSDRIDALEYEVLKLFQRGMSIDGFCDWLEAQETSKAEQAEAALQHWFQTWSAKALLTSET